MSGIISDEEMANIATVTFNPRTSQVDKDMETDHIHTFIHKYKTCQEYIGIVKVGV